MLLILSTVPSRGPGAGHNDVDDVQPEQAEGRAAGYRSVHCTVRARNIVCFMADSGCLISRKDPGAFQELERTSGGFVGRSFVGGGFVSSSFTGGGFIGGSFARFRFVRSGHEFPSREESFRRRQSRGRSTGAGGGLEDGR